VTWKKNKKCEEAPWRAFRADAARVRRAAVAGMDAPQKADRCGQDAANREALLG
jgi:hypothetical protein